MNRCLLKSYPFSFDQTVLPDVFYRSLDPSGGEGDFSNFLSPFVRFSSIQSSPLVPFKSFLSIHFFFICPLCYYQNGVLWPRYGAKKGILCLLYEAFLAAVPL